MRVSNPLYRVYHENLGNFLLKRLCIFRVEEGDCGLLEKKKKMTILLYLTMFCTVYCKQHYELYVKNSGCMEPNYTKCLFS